MHKFSTRDLTLAALIAAVYAVLTVTLPVPQYAGVQCRLSEALTVLPFLSSGGHAGTGGGLLHRQPVLPLPPGHGLRHAGHSAWPAW